ncbi:MAG: hypothetical protein VX346_18110 [Planctomycetota bacterium]|nr:hypothetical protein [Planctomycetota bacterium]
MRFVRGDLVTDAGLVHLQELKGLRYLSLPSQTTDEGLEHLQALPQLQSLHLSNAKINGDGLVYLRGMRKLTTLNLSYSRVTDEGLVHVKRLRNLEILNLKGTSITDAGLVHLGGLKRLKMIILNKSVNRITAGGIARPKQKLPKCATANQLATHRFARQFPRQNCAAASERQPKRPHMKRLVMGMVGRGSSSFEEIRVPCRVRAANHFLVG